MSPLSIEERVAALEAEVVFLKQKVVSPEVPVIPWRKKIAGTFTQDSVYKEAMKLGRQYRRYCQS
ncbi:MAG TPA: hypothetical protein DEG17_24740 [Cyanobacteria bacterium UBA11149]|nr:hypothetical protein [Cyanobacteria bacterium UBA11367]HBE59610.1 hypothetical protein [Cyanobacteria bacterium UBA11366]HBK65136.1 hypothetical protein [Cyanobacteria bacterium UBA11166]HBR75449.1 hypothetical protein [Cyanobacteria bacterium UBA11159]HBS70009.1 hypothetical protein [Cyanobacteria bacterium UBA11153]HBW91986.1 hypothetical protein [Cyanobacteria bacterium UBA11149]HCA94118.1 hypothetical protein [Cyanobacteria bacterium UBA9226]